MANTGNDFYEYLGLCWGLIREGDLRKLFGIWERGDIVLKKDIKVEAFWDEEAKVLVAPSDDVPGLITEAATMELLMQKIRVLIPELFRANKIVTDDESILNGSMFGGELIC